VNVKLHDGQKEIANDLHRFRIICAGRRWGKSVLAQLITLKWAVESVGVYWIVSPTYRQGKQIHWRGLQQIIPRDWVLKKNEVELSITLKNGSTIELKGAENPDALRGVKLRGLVIDEIASIRNWDWLWSEVLRPTLTDYKAPALFISTPKGYNHFYELYETGQKEDENYKSWRFSSYDNPFIPSTEIDQAKIETGQDVFSQEYLAEFTRFTGLVYKEFNPDIHVHPFDHEKNSYGDYYFGLDFAVRGWTAAIVGYIKSDGHIYLLDEYKEQGETVQVHAPSIQEVLTTYADFDKYEGYADPAGFSKTQQGMRKNQSMVWSLADEYFDFDFPIVRANNEVVAGINFVRQLFRQGKIHIHPRCSKLIEELQLYQWKDQPSTQIGAREEPEEVRKINDHLVDALRYMLYSKPTAPEEEEVKRPALLPAQFPKINLYPEEKEEYEEVDFGNEITFT
jgi:PBSX family phage terminase large subunit